MALAQSVNSWMSAAAASVRGCLNAAGRAYIDKAMSIAESNTGTHVLRQVLVPHQTSAPSSMAGTFNVNMLCTAPRGARPDAGTGCDRVAVNFAKTHTAMATPS